MKKSVILFNPPLYYSRGRPYALDSSVPPLGLFYLATYINHYSENLEASVYDIGPEGLAADRFHIVDKKRPIAIGITSMTPQLQGCLELAKNIKERYPEIPVFLGGPHVSADPDFVRRHSNLFDYAIMGEAEKTFLDSLEKINRGIQIPKIQASEIIYDLDTIPFPDRKLIDRKKYSPRESIIFSRGCPYKCYYCSRPAISTKVRYRSPNHVLGEIMANYQYCAGGIDFQDDTFTIDRERVLELSRMIIKEKIKFDWNCNTRVDLVDEELLYLMSNAGCSLIHFGIESGCQELRRDVILKGSLSNAEIKEIFALCKKFKIKVGGYFMIGYPGETLESIEKTKHFIMTAGVDLLGISIPTPFPGSRLYDIAVQDGLISAGIIDQFAEKKLGEGYAGNYPVYIDKGLPGDKVFELRKQIIRKFYLRPSIIFSFLIDNMHSFKGLKKVFSGGLDVVFRGSSKRQPYIYKSDKIVMVTPFFPPNIGGLETHLKYYTDFLAEQGIPTAVLTYKPLTTKVNSWQQYERHNSVEIYRFWWWGITLFDKFAKCPILEFIYMVPKLFLHVLAYSLKNKKDIRVFHAHGLIAAFIVRIVGIFIRKRKVVSTHYIYNVKRGSFFTGIFLWIFNGFDKVLAVGEESKSDLMNVGYPKEKIIVYNHSIDNKQLFTIRDKTGLRKKYLLDDKDTIVLFVGRLLEMKGIKKLVNAASLNPDIKFIFVGSGVLSEYLENSSRQYSNVRYMGQKSKYELAEIYNISDMVVLPSREEGSSLVVIEALSCGRPVIVTNKGCSKDMFPNDLGRKIEPTEENIIEAIRQLQKEDLNLLGERCRKFALKTYSEDNFKKILETYL